MKKRVVELFAGVGGFRLAFEKTTDEWNFVYANQWEPSRKSQWAYECYCEHFGYKDIHTNIDIGEVDKSKIPSHDVLVGGFPCQDYSVARTQAKGIHGKKGVLWWDIYETIKVKEPRFILLENVDRLLKSPSKQRGRDFGVMLYCLYSLGYSVEWRVINAAEYGFNQRRRRVFIYASKINTNYEKLIRKKTIEEILTEEGFFARQFEVYKDINIINKSLQDFTDIIEVSDEFNFEFKNTGILNNEGKIYTAETKPIKIKEGKLKDVLETNVSSAYYLTEEEIKDWEYLKGAKRIERISSTGHKYTFSEGAIPFPDPINKSARTILTGESSKSRSTHIIEDPETKKLRKLTPVEVERLNGFPKDWTKTKNMSNSFRYFCMGNALVVGVVKKMSKELNNIINKEK